MDYAMVGKQANMRSRCFPEALIANELLKRA
jgi:hypothetical protein